MLVNEKTAQHCSYPKRPITDIFTRQDGTIDRRGFTRVVPMRVLCLGLGRTGTNSLRLALKELGFEDTYHMMSASTENPPDSLLWLQALRAKYDGEGQFGRAEWDALLGHCQAVSDWPAIAFVPELVAVYPEAKVILTTRDVHRWYDSVLGTAHWRATDRVLRLAAKLDWGAGLYWPMLHKFWTCFWEGDFEGNAKRIFRQHYAEVRAVVPPERLLEYSIEQGWEPLCEFLGVEVPKTAFPRLNDAASFKQRCRRRNFLQLLNVLFRWVCYVLAFGSLVFLYL